jgi:hypothetical protein
MKSIQPSANNIIFTVMMLARREMGGATLG